MDHAVIEPDLHRATLLWEPLVLRAIFAGGVGSAAGAQEVVSTAAFGHHLSGPLALPRYVDQIRNAVRSQRDRVHQRALPPAGARARPARRGDRRPPTTVRQSWQPLSTRRRRST